MSRFKMTVKALCFLSLWMPALASAKVKSVKIEIPFTPSNCKAAQEGLRDMLNWRKFLPGVHLIGSVSCQSTEPQMRRRKMIVRYTVSLPEEGTATKASFESYKYYILGFVSFSSLYHDDQPSDWVRDLVSFFNDVIHRFAHYKDRRFCYYNIKFVNFTPEHSIICE